VKAVSDPGTLSSQERVGAVVVHFGDVARTFECLDSFFVAINMIGKNYSVARGDVVVVDNSGNVLPEKIELRYGGNVTYLRPESNIGFAGGCIIGIESLKEVTVLVLCNNDIVLHKKTLANLLACLRELPDCGALQPVVLVKGKNPPVIDSFGFTFSPLMNCFNYANWNVPHLQKSRLANGCTVTECFGAEGLFLVVRRDRFDEVGGWDPSFWMFQEDALLSWKFRLRGYKNYVCEDSVVFHERGGTAKGYLLKVNPIFPAYYISRNKILSVFYLYKLSWLAKYLAIVIIGEFAKNLFLSIRFKSALYLCYYFKALLFIVRHRKHAMTERLRVVKKVDVEGLLSKRDLISISSAVKLILQRLHEIVG
jgi:GT2 family glycosyltransferase